MIIYLHPFNERVRTMLRLDELYRRFERLVSRNDSLSHHAALGTLFEIMELSSRAEVRADLLHELERQRQTLASFKNDPDVAIDALSSILGEIEDAAATLQHNAGKAGQALRENDWLMNIRSRSVMAGCSFQVDLPFYYAWQHRPPEERREAIIEWARPFGAVRECLTIVLRLLRESGQKSRVTSQNGSYQQQLGGKTYQLAEIHLDETLGAIPEFSANKYMLWIRFGRLDREFKTRPYEGSVDFELSLCNL